MSGTGLTRTFIMPAHHISVVAVFRLSGYVFIVETDNYPSLGAYAQNGVLYVSGLQPGAQWSVYHLPGVLIHRNIATDNKAEIRLPERGYYIILSADSAVKVVY